jgi:hypothetical protein
MKTWRVKFYIQVGELDVQDGSSADLNLAIEALATHLREWPAPDSVVVEEASADDGSLASISFKQEADSRAQANAVAFDELSRIRDDLLSESKETMFFVLAEATQPHLVRV